MEARLTDFPPENYEGDEGNTEDVKIAVVTFAFNNSEIKHIHSETENHNSDIKHINSANKQHQF
jgi:hypothetical protein